MRGDTQFRVYGVHAGRARDNYFGCFRTRIEAEAEVARLLAREMHGENWAARYHNKGFEIRRVTVTTDFEPPPLPKPRDAYFVSAAPWQSSADTWTQSRVSVHRRAPEGAAPGPLFQYDRPHAMYETFEPFRQGDRAMALVSMDYTFTSVIDLASGAVIAEEQESKRGFCPVGFYVPDWWDVHDASILTGSESWNATRHEWPDGSFGFVWGCAWGDDRAWKLQCLDLRAVQGGVLVRDERFGYLEVDTRGWSSPCFDEARALESARSKTPPFLTVSEYSRAVDVRTTLSFELESGRLTETQAQLLAGLTRPPNDDEK